MSTRKKSQQKANTIESQKASKAEKQPQKIAAQAQQYKLKSLLYRNRSLKQFFGESLPTQPATNPPRPQQQHPTPKKHPFGSGPDSKHCVTNRPGKKDRTPEDEYLLTANKTKTQQKPQCPKKSENNRQHMISKATVPTNRIDCQNLLIESKISNTSEGEKYDPNAYNWRKSLSKQKGDQCIQNKLRSVRSSKMMHSEYYPAGRPKEGEQNARLKELAPNQKSSEYVPRFLKKEHARSKSSLSRPKVIKNIFEPYSPKMRREPSCSSGHLLYTFGV